MARKTEGTAVLFDKGTNTFKTFYGYGTEIDADNHALFNAQGVADKLNPLDGPRRYVALYHAPEGATEGIEVLS